METITKLRRFFIESTSFVANVKSMSRYLKMKLNKYEQMNGFVAPPFLNGLTRERDMVREWGRGGIQYDGHCH